MYQSLELWLWYSTDTAVDLQHCAARVHTALGKNSPMSILYSSLADLMLAISKPSTLVKFGSRLLQITPHIALCCCNQLCFWQMSAAGEVLGYRVTDFKLIICKKYESHINLNSSSFPFSQRSLIYFQAAASLQICTIFTPVKATALPFLSAGFFTVSMQT